jgi:alkylated DNA repair dioxygenase AlkB
MKEQFDMFGFPEDVVENNKHVIRNGEYIYIYNFFSNLECNEFYMRLKEQIKWKQESMNMYGKQLNFPRLTAWYGDRDKPYSFSGIKLQPNPWTEDLLLIKSKVESQTDKVFNSVLLNQYRDGNDSISWHTDAEPELGNNPVIASVTFGATRKFQLRHKETKEKIELELVNGSLLVMQGELQHFWQHQIPKSTTVKNGRINLTFRSIYPKK